VTITLLPYLTCMTSAILLNHNFNILSVIVESLGKIHNTLLASAKATGK